MGGSGGNGGGGLFGGTGSGGPEATPCSKLRFTTTVVSPKIAVLGTINVNQKLRVALIDTDPDRPRVVVQTSNGAEAGSLLPTDLPRLIECLRKGQNYWATVLEIASPRCRVEVAAT